MILISFKIPPSKSFQNILYSPNPVLRPFCLETIVYSPLPFFFFRTQFHITFPPRSLNFISVSPRFVVVTPGSIAHRAGLRAGDELAQIDQADVRDWPGDRIAPL